MNIELQGLTKRFPARGRKAKGETTAVQDLTFTVPDGKLVGLLGPSGCGKSTTLNMICGLETPTAGKIFFGGEEVTALPPEYTGEAVPAPAVVLESSGTLTERMEAYEGQIIRDAYRRCGTTVAVAKDLGISQATAARKIAKYVSAAERGGRS